MIPTKILRKISILSFLIFINTYGFSQDIPAYFTVATVPESIEDAAKNVKTALQSGGFEIIGDYHPENNVDLYVIVFTRNDLKNITFNIHEGGALAAALKVGLIRKDSKTIVSLLNPEYLFYGYLRENVKDYSELNKISDDTKTALKSIGTDFEPFGGELSLKKLKKYHYMVGMPYFDDMVKLKEFPSFNDGVKTIKKNLQENIGSTYKVYELINKEKRIAVFGVGLISSVDGEAKFLPIIGEDHIAAMPYEIILTGNNASMLHGRFRIAFHWPELTMGTFTKIMSTPGKIEDFMKELME